MAQREFLDAVELMNHTGPGTPLGRLLRRYWVPVMLAKDLPDPWAAPVRVKLLGESLVVFKDTTGRIALLQEFCAHRRASLYFGRNEGEGCLDGQPGLRCPYHGWKYDVTGQCIDMPNEPASSRFKEHVRLTSYPAVERGGMIWAYMGVAEEMPGLPELESRLGSRMACCCLSRYTKATRSFAPTGWCGRGFRRICRSRFTAYRTQVRRQWRRSSSKLTPKSS